MYVFCITLVSDLIWMNFDNCRHLTLKKMHVRKVDFQLTKSFHICLICMNINY